MKFDLKLFVLVGVLAGLRDVWGMEENEDDVGFYVNKKVEENEEVNAAVVERRVIRAVYTTGLGGQIPIIHKNFKDKLSSIWLCEGYDAYKKSIESLFADNDYKLRCTMINNSKYTVYFIFKKELFAGTAEELFDSTVLMFEACTSLIHADFRHFDTTSVKRMYRMFDGCIALTELNFSKFDTQNVTDMSYMFYGCTALSKLNLSNFDTKNVTNMSGMFNDCTALKNLNLGNFDFHNVVKIDDMFTGCNFDNLCIPNTRKRCWCCGDRYVDLKGNVVVKLNQNNVEFEVVHDDPVSNNTSNLV